MRKCKKCLESKGDDFFHADKTREDNRHPYCKACLTRHKIQTDRYMGGK